MGWGLVIDILIIAGLISTIIKALKLGRGILHSVIMAVLCAGSYLIALSFFVVILVGLPIPTGLKNAIYSSRLCTSVLARTITLQANVDHVIDHDIAPSFLTVQTKSDTTTINLGFHTTNTQVRPDLEAQMLVLVNQERTRRGIPALTLNTKARDVARAHSSDMFARGYFSHYTPEGLSPFDRLRAANVDFLSAGENVALAPTLRLAHTGLMNSPEHKANILDAQFHTVGIGIVSSNRYGVMVTQDFTN